MNVEAIYSLLAAKEHLGFYYVGNDTVIFMYKDSDGEIKHITNTVEEGHLCWKFCNQDDNIIFHKI